MDLTDAFWGYIGSAGLIAARIIAKYSKNPDVHKRWGILVALGILLLIFKLAKEFN